MHLIILLLFCQGVNAGSTPSSKTGDAGNVHIAKLSKDKLYDTIYVAIENPETKNISCEYSDTSKSLVNSYWVLKDGNRSQTSAPQKVLNYTFNATSVGNYSCVFTFSEGEAKANFVFKVPSIKERDKPIVSYIGDSVVLECLLKEGSTTWQWYALNGTKKSLLNDTDEPDKYKIQSETNKTSLTVLDLIMEDSRKYACKAQFGVGSTEAYVELKVLSFTEPLKPFLAIAAEVVILVTLILLYERQSHSRKKNSETTENGPQCEQTNKLTQDDNNGVDGGTTARQRKSEQ
ncbi:embigin-like [Hoplias malabaricus]|uniref:embigin-like n=1 Tax=Hoplias malabaricus TaxID=27720 RepID=UPI0034619DA1